MDKFMDMVGRILVSSLTNVKDELLEEVRDLGDEIENNLRRGILEGVEAATKPVTYIFLAAGIVFSAALMLLYGLSQAVDTLFATPGVGYVLVGAGAMVLSLAVASSASSMLKNSAKK